MKTKLWIEFINLWPNKWQIIPSVYIEWNNRPTVFVIEFAWLCGGISFNWERV